MLPAPQKEAVWGSLWLGLVLASISKGRVSVSVINKVMR
jgi:hypothetical protein